MRRWHRTPLVRVSSIAALIAAACWALYVLVANAVLVTGYLESRVTSPDERLLELGSAWTLWPGRVHVRDFRFRLAEEDLELELRIERATVQIELGALVRRTFHVLHVDADGTRYRMRRLLDDPERHPLRARALARIEGLPDTPRARPEVDDPRPLEERKLWTLEITGIDARVAEIWIDELKYVGPGLIRGGFRFEPMREIEVRDSRVTLGPGPLGFGELRPIASRIEGSIGGHVETLDVSDDAPLGWPAFRHFTLHGALQADVADLGFVKAYAERSELEIGEGGGALELAFSLVRGRFGPEDRVEYRTARLDLGFKQVAARGDARVVLDTIERDGQQRGRARLAGRRIQIGVSSARPLATVRDFELELVGDSVDLAKDWRAYAGHVKLPKIRLPELARLNALRNGGDWRLIGGALSGSASAELDQKGGASGRIALRAESAAARIGKLRVRATGSARTSLVRPDLRAPRGQLRDARLDLHRFSFVTPTGSSGPGKLSARSALVELRDLRPGQFEVDFSSAFDSADGVLDALDVARTGVARAARWFVDLDDLRVKGNVRYDSGKLRVQIDRARTDGVDAKGVMKRRGKEESSRFDVDLGLFGFEVKSGCQRGADCAAK
jgi:hypothetical protein